MKVLVIHPEDSSTQFLSEIYADKNWTVISNNPSSKHLVDQIKSHDRIVMLGHGTKDGLIGFGKLIINSKLVYLLRNNECVCIWCNADQFVSKYKLKGFYTAMIISEYDEAEMFLNYPFDYNDIYLSNKLFSKSIKDSIDNLDMVKSIKSQYKSDSNQVILFNEQNLYESE